MCLSVMFGVLPPFLTNVMVPNSEPAVVRVSAGAGVGREGADVGMRWAIGGLLVWPWRRASHTNCGRTGFGWEMPKGSGVHFGSKSVQSSSPLEKG